MAVRFVNYFLDNFDIEQFNGESDNSVWNSAELHHHQNLNHSRTPNMNHQMSFNQLFCIGNQVENYYHCKIDLMKRF